MTGSDSLQVELDSPRLILRRHTRADFPDMVTLWSDPDVVRHIGGRPFSEEEVWTRLLRYAGHWSLLGFGYWTVRRREDGGFVGEVGFADFHRDLQPGFDGAPEIGWVLSPAMHGQGFATEAVTAALAWAERRFGPAGALQGRTVCMIEPDNTASLRVAEKVGFRRYAQTRYHDAPTCLFER